MLSLTHRLGCTSLWSTVRSSPWTHSRHTSVAVHCWDTLWTSLWLTIKMSTGTLSTVDLNVEAPSLTTGNPLITTTISTTDLWTLSHNFHKLFQLPNRLRLLPSCLTQHSSQHYQDLLLFSLFFSNALYIYRYSSSRTVYQLLIVYWNYWQQWEVAWEITPCFPK